TEQAAQVREANLRRNYDTCVTGRYGCKSELLTTEQAAQVREASSRRNYDTCVTGRYGCKSELLTTEQAAQVHDASLRRNYDTCVTGRYGCKSELLTTEQAAQVHEATAVRAQNQPSFGTPQSTPTPAAGVAENGSYYGEPNANGVPKTVHVNGYYRKDGT